MQNQMHLNVCLFAISFPTSLLIFFSTTKNTLWDNYLGLPTHAIQNLFTTLLYGEQYQSIQFIQYLL